MDFFNVYEDKERAKAYAGLEFPGTYYLAYRDLPWIITKHVTGKKAIDFGCGTGRSTRVLQKLGFKTSGVDISEAMIKKAKEQDPLGDYRLIEDGDFHLVKDQAYDLILSVFTFDNIPTMERKVKIFKEFREVLGQEGRIIHLVSAPEIYTHEWVSFSTKDFPENNCAKLGDKVKIIMKDVQDRRPVEDILWTDEAYQEGFKKAGLEVVNIFKPLAKEDEPYSWINETRIPPWVIYVIKKPEKR